MAPRAQAPPEIGDDFLVGDWLAETRRGTLAHDGLQVHLEPKAMEVLVALAAAAGNVVLKDDLLRTVWPDTFVSEHALTHTIWQLRQVFGNEAIETAPRRGYRLRMAVRPAPVRIRSLAVLPLANLTGDPEQEYFAEGMTEALITGLAQIGALRVISRTSAMQYKNTSKPLPQIAQELSVDAVIEGSILQAAARVRITVQLIHGSSDRHLWARTYDGDFGTVLALQDEITRGIVEQINVSLTCNERGRLTRPRQAHPKAQLAYMKARYCHSQASVDGLTRSIEYCREAIRIDPDFSLAYAGLADSVALLSSPVAEAIPPAEANRLMRPAVARALELDPDSAQGHFLLGWIKTYYEWDWPVAEAETMRALELNPGLTLATAGLATIYEAQAKYDLSIEYWRRTCELDPLSFLYGALLGWVHVQAGRPREAEAQVRTTLRMEPNFWMGHEVLGIALLDQGRFQEGLEEIEIAVQLGGDNLMPRGIRARAWAFCGRREEALRVLAELEEIAKHRYVAPNLQAWIYEALGDVDNALKCMERALEVRDASLIWVKSFWHPLRHDPRYWKIVRAVFPEG